MAVVTDYNIIIGILMTWRL